jgi:hypothetical protein
MIDIVRIENQKEKSDARKYDLGLYKLKDGRYINLVKINYIAANRVFFGYFAGESGICTIFESALQDSEKIYPPEPELEQEAKKEEWDLPCLVEHKDTGKLVLAIDCHLPDSGQVTFYGFSLGGNRQITFNISDYKLFKGTVTLKNR